MNCNPFTKINLFPYSALPPFYGQLFKTPPLQHQIPSNFRESSTSHPYSKGDTHYG